MREPSFIDIALPEYLQKRSDDLRRELKELGNPHPQYDCDLYARVNEKQTRLDEVEKALSILKGKGITSAFYDNPNHERENEK